MIEEKTSGGVLVSLQFVAMWQVWDGPSVRWVEVALGGGAKTGSPLMTLNFRGRENCLFGSLVTPCCLGFTRPGLLWNNCCVSKLAEQWLFLSVWLFVGRLHMPVFVPRRLVSQRLSICFDYISCLQPFFSIYLFSLPASTLMFCVVWQYKKCLHTIH